MGGRLMVQALALAARGALQPVPQPLEGITYASKVDKAEAAIDWSQSALSITRKVHAFNPFPGAHTQLGNEVLKVWAAEIGKDEPQEHQLFGKIVALVPAGIAVIAMNSIVILTELQRPGGKRLPAAEFLRGCPLQPGQVLG
jgi:methionyl-tRNA formyltransferase